MPTMRRALRETIKHGWRWVFERCQRLGFDILPRHFYSSIPDFHELRTRSSWKEPLSMCGINGAEPESQLAWARECCPPESVERMLRVHVYDHACKENGEEGYGPVEADFLFCFICSKRPRRIVQVGAGVSTAVMLLALQQTGQSAEIVCVDPYPTDYLRRLAAKGSIRLLAVPAQDVELGVLTNLSAGDLLFVDSTHTVKVGGEVNHIILEVLPRLQQGTYVHFHDIYFPYDYPEALMNLLFFQNEHSLLYAFLLQNSHYTIRASLSMLHHLKTAELKTLLPAYCPAEMDHGLLKNGAGHFPDSIYLQVI
jgi:predicted O-methyltransferase YrrM